MLNTLDIYNSLNAAYGPAVWWSDNAYTVMVEAILVQNTSWSSVEKVMQTLPQELTPLYISVYVFHKPVFIVDAYSRRFLMKLGLNFDTDEEIKRFFEKSFRKDYRLFGWIHWLILQHGIKHCKKTPICHDCIFKNKCTSVVPIME